MAPQPDLLCIGSVLWDVIGSSPTTMSLGHDVPGRIRRLPGGVAMNIAIAGLQAGMRPALLSVLGRDNEGRALADACAAMGLDTRYLSWSDDFPTDSYMAIEAAGTLVAAIADAHSLEATGARILAPLTDGSLATIDNPWKGVVALDGNLTEALLSEIAESALFAQADLRLAPASPGKVRRLIPLLAHPRATLYLNRIEARLLCGVDLDTAEHAAAALLQRGARRVLVTDGAAAAAMASQDGVISAFPPPVAVTRVTGAGDTFMAAHIAAERRGEAALPALHSALSAAAAHISGSVA